MGDKQKKKNFILSYFARVHVGEEKRKEEEEKEEEGEGEEVQKSGMLLS